MGIAHLQILERHSLKEPQVMGAPVVHWLLVCLGFFCLEGVPD